MGESVGHEELIEELRATSLDSTPDDELSPRQLLCRQAADALAALSHRGVMREEVLEEAARAVERIDGLVGPPAARVIRSLASSQEKQS